MEKEEKKKMLEYIQQLWNKMIAENTAHLEGAEESQVAGSKYKENASVDEERYQPSKKAKEKYHGDDTVKMGDANPCKQYMHTGQNCLVHYSR